MPKLTFTPIAADPAYVDLAKARDTLMATRASKRSELNTVLERLREKLAGRNVDATPSQADKAIAEVMGKPIPQADPDLRVQHGALAAELRILDDATEAVADKMRRAANAASINVCAALKSEHDRLSRDLVLAMLETHSKVMRLRQFVSELEDGGVLTHHLVDHEPSFLQARDKYGQFAAWLDEMSKTGLISRSDIPRDLNFRL